MLHLHQSRRAGAPTGVLDGFRTAIVRYGFVTFTRNGIITFTRNGISSVYACWVHGIASGRNGIVTFTRIGIIITFTRNVV